MKVLSIVFLSLLPCFLAAQNVGIGTTTPTEKLEIKNLLRSTLKISSNSFDDTTELLFSNRTIGNQGTSFSLKSIKEIGLFLSSSSDLAGNNSNNTLVVTPVGNVGIGVLPTYKLSVAGTTSLNGLTRLEGANLFEFGAGVPGKETNAGKIGYNAFGVPALTFVGAGTSVTNRSVYFFAEGGTTMNGPVNIGGPISLNGNAGTSGQVLTSNGSADPTWRNTSFSNNVRFAVYFQQGPSVFDEALILSTKYNLNPTDIVIGTDRITLNRSGLYHFDIGARGSLNFASTTAFRPSFEVDLYTSTGSSIKVIPARSMESGTYALSSSYSSSDKVSVDIYVTAPAAVRLGYSLNTLGIPGGSSSHSFSAFMTCHLISE